MRGKMPPRFPCWRPNKFNNRPIKGQWTDFIHYTAQNYRQNTDKMLPLFHRRWKYYIQNG